MKRQDIINFPFPHKLWLVVHLDFLDCLRWNRDGTVILLDLEALEDYLNSTRSIFRIKNRFIFLEHLEQFKFERLKATMEAGLLLQYKNENFRRHRLDLLAKIRRHTYQLLGEIEKKDCSGAAGSAEAVAKAQRLAAQMKSRRVAERMLGDLCFMSHGGLSNIQKSRLRFRTILSFQNETRILQKKLHAFNDQSAAPSPQRRLRSDVLTEEEQVIELRLELFENPHDSVLHLGDDFRPEYAGYYGNCSKEQILHFFGDYLPMYEDGSMDIKKIVPDVCASNRHSMHSDTEQSRELMQPSEEDYKLTSTPIQALSIPTLNLSSTLEPIFKTEAEEEEEIRQNSTKNGGVCKEDMEPIAMDTAEIDCLRFLPTCKTEDPYVNRFKNEVNFHNFFSQYRQALNLLNECQ